MSLSYSFRQTLSSLGKGNLRERNWFGARQRLHLSAEEEEDGRRREEEQQQQGSVHRNDRDEGRSPRSTAQGRAVNDLVSPSHQFDSYDHQSRAMTGSEKHVI